VSDDLTLLPEVRARQLLRGRRIHSVLLAPFGAWAGRGTLRVLRVRMDDDDSAELTVGYESYERLAS
jgi:hypothetical protein